MKVLLIHPEDGLLGQPWGALSWDRIVDLGLSGEESYRRAAGQFGGPVTHLNAFRGGNFEEIQSVRELLSAGNERLKDATGLDWWELTAIFVHQQLETIIVLRKLIKSLGPRDEVHVSRPGLHAEVMKMVLGSRVYVFPSPTSRQGLGVKHGFQLLKKFPPRQLLDIFWDKKDSGYQFRGRLSKPPKPSATPVVLLPTAYVSVSKTAISYAKVLPETHFLLVATRRSGWIDGCPANVSRAWLRSYSFEARAARTRECLDLVERWRILREELEGIAEFEILSRVGCFDEFPMRFARGLEIRDAWRNVLEREPVQSVLCADDSNPYTHIPLLLAAQKNLPTINCHHGALDGRYMFKKSHADVTLAKGRMERDYLVRICRIPADQIDVGAPTGSFGSPEESDPDAKSVIVFFSEMYETGGGRAKDSYEDILPRLADLAISEGKQLIVKLHPFESMAERRGLVNLVLRRHQRKVVRILGGELTSDLWSKTWFGITVLSTVAVEGALRGVPCFLCGWLEASPYGYVEQFSRFGAGIRLSSAIEIEKIPTILRSYKPSPTIEKDLATRIETQHLSTLLSKHVEKKLTVIGQNIR
jgi:hypothetical protein